MLVQVNPVDHDCGVNVTVFEAERGESVPLVVPQEAVEHLHTLLPFLSNSNGY